MAIPNIKKAFQLKKERGWDTLYVAIDVHETILEGKYESNQSYNPSKECIEVLQWMSNRPDIRIIIWTSSYAKDYKRLKEWFFENYNITFDYHNENPECGNTEYAEFTTKFYFNLLIDDKAGWDMNVDWTNLKLELINIGEW